MSDDVRAARCPSCRQTDEVHYWVQEDTGQPQFECWRDHGNDANLDEGHFGWFPQQENGAGPHVIARAADLSRARPTRWAWQNRFAIGCLNLLIGNEGVGKGTLIAWMAAQWTHGLLDGDLKGQAISVGILGDEDDFDDVWTPRLHAAGADLSRVLQIERADGDVVHVRADREKLAVLLEENGIKVVIYDQLLDNLDFDPKGGNQQKAIRDALRPARALARQLGVAVLGALHPNKRGQSFRDLVAGSVAYNAVSRSSMFLADHPQVPDRRVLVRGKGNLSEMPDSFDFHLGNHLFTANDELFAVPVVQDIQYGQMTADDLIGVDAPKDDTQIGRACSLIRLRLPRDGWYPARPLYDWCAEEGIKERTVERAKAKLELESKKTPTVPPEALWRWPGSPDNEKSYVGTDGFDGFDGSKGDIPDKPDVPHAQDSAVGTGQMGLRLVETEEDDR